MRKLRECGRKPKNWRGSAVLTLARVHRFLFDLVECRISELPENSDLFISIKRHKLRGEEQGEIIEYKLPNKLDAIGKWMDLKGEGAQANAHGALAGLLGRVRK